MHSVPWAFQQNLVWLSSVYAWLAFNQESKSVIKCFYNINTCLFNLINKSICPEVINDQLCCSLILPHPRPESGTTYRNWHHLKLLRMYVLVKDIWRSPFCLPHSTFGFISFHQGGLKCLKLPLLFSFALSLFRFQGPSLTAEVFFFFNYSLLALCIANERLKGIFLWKALLQYVFSF